MFDTELSRPTVSDLEKVFANLPQPHRVEIYTKGKLDYSPISQQLQSIIQGITVEQPVADGTYFAVSHPTNHLILQIAQHVERSLELPKIEIKKATWLFGKREEKLEMDGHYFTAYYRGEEPEHFRRIREILPLFYSLASEKIVY